MRARLVAMAAAAAAAALTAGGCSVSGLELVAGSQLEIVTPNPNEEVRLPLEVRWQAKGRTLIEPGTPGDGVYFAVFVDRPPLRPGEHLVELVDDTCRRTPRCATRRYFAERNVYLTGEPRVVVDAVADHKVHRVTVVMFDEDNVRVGEVAASVEVRIDEEP